MATLNHNWGASPRPYIPSLYTDSTSKALSLRPGPSRNRAELIAQYGSPEAYEAALLAGKKERRQRRSAEVIVLRKLVQSTEQVSLEDFKTECEALLDNLRAMPDGKPKTPEQMNVELARFAEQWFRRGQHKAVVEVPASTITPKPEQPHFEIIPAARGLISAPSSFIPPSEEQGCRAANPTNLADMEFIQAAAIFLQRKRVHIRKSTLESYVKWLKMLSVYFAGLRLNEIHNAHLEEYQACRSKNIGGSWFAAHGTPWEHPSGYSNTNHELNTVSQVLRMAKLWKNLSEDYKPLSPSGFKKPKVMTDEEKRKFYAAAASRSEWQIAFWAAAITNHTTASGVELRNLTLGDVFLDAKPKPYIQVNPETAKCRNRGREVYLDATARAAMARALDRARELGACRSAHYVFPFRQHRNCYDVTRPASSSWLRVAWDGIREATGLDWITPHALRHQCLTELMEKDAPPEQMRKIAGHLSSEMTEHYTHNRLHKQAEALDRLEPIPEVL